MREDEGAFGPQEVCRCSKAESDLLELPFFEEDISKVFEIEINPKIKKRKKIRFSKRKRYFRKYRNLNVKQRLRSIAESTTRVDKHIDPKDSNKENDYLDIARAKDPILPSGGLTVCDMETNQIIKQNQQGHSNVPELQDAIQTAGEIKQESYTAGDSKASTNKEGTPVQGQSNKEGSPVQGQSNKEGSPVQGQSNKEGSPVQGQSNKEGSPVQGQSNKEGSPVQGQSNKEGSPVQGQSLQTIAIENIHQDTTDAKIKKDNICQPSEGGEELETECEVLQDLSRETENGDGLGDGNLDVQVNNVQQTSSDKRLRPNYFVAIPVTSDEILDLIEDVQEHIVLQEPKLLRALIPAEKVHITIVVAHLQTEEDIRRAMAALLQSKERVEKVLHGEPFGLTLHGIGQFNNQVIFIKIREQQHELLSKVAEIVTQSFIDAGVDITGSKNFKPHLTFLKLSKVPSLRRKGFRRICSDLYKEYEDSSFGTEMLSRIDLCSMHKKNKESGYYYCESSILIDGKIPHEGKESISEIKEDLCDPVPGRETCADSSHTFSSLAKDADKISSDISDTLTISQEERIKETDGQPEATNTNPGEKSCSQSTPDLFPAEPIASAAVDDGLEKQN